MLLLLIGVVLLITGALWKNVSWSVKIVIFLFVAGIQCIILALLLLMPGSSDVIAQLLKLKE
nr:hypothetical protein [Lederbergia lenta]